MRFSPQRTAIFAWYFALLSTFAPLLSGRTAHARETCIGKTRVEDGDSLKIVSLRLYGTVLKWRALARANSIAPPYRVRAGQDLCALAGLSILPKREGEARVLEMWRRQQGLDAESVLGTPVSGASLSKVAPSARVFEQGKALFDSRRYTEALTYFRRGIAIDPKAIQAWFYSFQTLKLLGRTSDRRKLIEDFLHDRPEFADLPMFQDRER